MHEALSFEVGNSSSLGFEYEPKVTPRWQRWPRRKPLLFPGLLCPRLSLMLRCEVIYLTLTFQCSLFHFCGRCALHTQLWVRLVLCKMGFSSLAGSRSGAWGWPEVCSPLGTGFYLPLGTKKSINTVTAFPLYQKAPHPVTIYFHKLVVGAKAYNVNFLCKYCTWESSIVSTPTFASFFLSHGLTQ